LRALLRSIGGIALALLLALPLGGLATGAPPPAAALLPVADDGRFLSNLSAPILAPGGSGAISLTLSYPLSRPLDLVTLTLAVYEFTSFPGNVSGAPPPGGSPTFSGGLSNGTNETIAVASIGPGDAFRVPGNLSVSVAAPAGAPDGTYDIRASLTFTENGTPYRMESRGFFPAALWASATELPNGTPTLNVSRLGVSGVLPETAVLVRTNPVATVLYVILGSAIVLAAAGGYVAVRRGAGSRSGAARVGPPKSAPSTFGNSLSSAGD
jgi:hypothetical protein